MAGLNFKTAESVTFRIPAGLHGSVTDLVERHNLALALKTFRIPAAFEAENAGGSARYIGVRLVKIP